MRRFLKIAAGLAAIGAVLLGASAVAIRVFLPPEKLKALAISAADQSLHRTLEVRSVELGVLSGLRLQGVRLSESPDFSKGEFLKADSFVLSPRWLPLLRKEIVARKIELRGASVSVVKGADGRLNFSDLLGPSAGISVPSAKKPGAHTAANIKINELEADGFGLSGPFFVSLDVQADYAAAGKRYSGSFQAKGKVNLAGGDQSRMSADLSSFALATQGNAVTGSLRFENAKAPKVSIQANVPALDSAFLNSALGGAAVPAGTALPAVKVEATLAYSAPAVDVSSFKLSAAGAELSGSASVADVNAKNPRYKLEAASNDFKLGPFFDVLPQFRGAGLAGKASLRVSVVSDGAAPTKASGTLTLDGVAAKYRGQVLEKTTGQIRFTQDSVDMPQLTGRLNGGDFKLKVTASNPAAPSVMVSGWLSLLDLGALQKLAGGPAPAGAASTQAAPGRSAAASSVSDGRARSSAPSARKAPAAGAFKTSGDITVDKTTHPNFESGKTTLTWNLTGVTPDMKRLSGTAKLLVSAGKVSDILDFAAARGGMVRAMLVPLEAMQKARDLHIPGLTPPDMQNIPFNKIEGDYSAVNGMITMQPFLLDSPAIGMNTTGTVDMGAQTVNLKTAVKSALGEIDLMITGPFSNLSIRPNVAQLQSAGKKLLQEHGQELLNRLFGH